MIVAAHQTMMGPQGAPLPFDAEVEYIESTGTQYVDIGADTPTSGSISISYEISGYSANAAMFGQQTSSTPRVLVWITSASGGFIDAGSTRINYSNATVNLAKTAYTAVSTPIPRYIFTSATTNGDPRSPMAQARLKKLQIWDANDVLVRDFQPVRVGSGAGAVGYLYDRVSGTLLGNAGTGNFPIGPDAT